MLTGTFTSNDAFDTRMLPLATVLKNGSAAARIGSVGNFNKVTAGAPASQAVTSGFQPGAVFLTSYQMGTQASTLNESICGLGLGASDGINEASSAITSLDGQATSVVDGIDKSSKVFLKMNTPPLDAEADMTSFGASGFTLNWTTNDTTASQICFLALGAP